jgi:hypothetical protein
MEDLQVKVCSAGLPLLEAAGLVRPDSNAAGHKCPDCTMAWLDARKCVFDVAADGASMVIMRATDHLMDPTSHGTGLVNFYKAVKNGVVDWDLLDERSKTTKNQKVVVYGNGREFTPPHMRAFFEATDKALSSSHLLPELAFTCPQLWRPDVSCLAWKEVRNFVDSLKGMHGPSARPWRDLFPGLSTRDTCHQKSNVWIKKWWEHSSALLVAGGYGSPHHLDTICSDPFCGPTMTLRDHAQTTPTDAWGLVLGPGTKLCSIVNRRSERHMTALGMWAADMDLGKTALQKKYSRLWKNKRLPTSFQGSYSMGWPTIGEALLLEQAYKVPYHFHWLRPNDWYMICRGTPHTVVNCGVSSSIAGDNFYEYRGNDDCALNAWAGSYQSDEEDADMSEGQDDS